MHTHTRTHAHNPLNTMPGKFHVQRIRNLALDGQKTHEKMLNITHY